MTANQMIPEYVDTKTPAARWYGYNLFILIASLGMTVLASLILEFETAKMRHPDIGFIETPMWFDLSVSSLIILLGLANLCVLIFVFLRHLWLRQWMLGTVVIGWVLLAIMMLVLGNRFLPIIAP